MVVAAMPVHTLYKIRMTPVQDVSLQIYIYTLHIPTACQVAHLSNVYMGAVAFRLSACLPSRLWPLGLHPALLLLLVMPNADVLSCVEGSVVAMPGVPLCHCCERCAAVAATATTCQGGGEASAELQCVVAPGC